MQPREGRSISEPRPAHKPRPRLSLLQRLFPARPDRRDAVRDLYLRLIEEARQSHWYVAGGVADDVNGRFAVLSSVVALALARLDGEAQASVALTELFVDDMEASLREIGIGDMVVGKRVGRLVSALGGRLGAYRDALAADDGAVFRQAVARNVYGGAEPTAAALDHTAQALRAFAERLERTGTDALVAGRVSA